MLIAPIAESALLLAGINILIYQHIYYKREKMLNILT
jgi:hypothetical protein